MTVKNLRYIEINTINPLYLHIDKTNGYIEESNGNENLMLVPADERKEIMKKYKELWSKIRELIRTITSSSDDYHEKYLKTKLNLDDDLPQNETLIKPLHIILPKASTHVKSYYVEPNWICFFG